MLITVDVSEQQMSKLVRERIEELFRNDSSLRKIVDEIAVAAVRSARDAMMSEFPAMASESVRLAVKDDIDKAAKRGLGVLRKLYAGFDPSKLTNEQRAWLEKQIADSASKEE
jgi:hypothetical protein